MVVEFLESKGAIPLLPLLDGTPHYDGHVVKTKVGTLRVMPYGDWIACRFEEPARANLLYYRRSDPPLSAGRLNPYSGKFNFHFGRQTAASAFEEFRSAISFFLGNP